MSFEYVILAEQRCIATRFTGRIFLKDVMTGSETMWDDPRYERDYHVLSDLRQITPRVNPAEVKTLVDFYRRPETSTGRWAAVFSQPDSTALGYLFQAALPIVGRLGIFSSWEGACEHLQISIPPTVFATPLRP